MTVLFADVVGSTTLGEQLDAESVRGVLARYFSVARVAVERHGGTLEKFIGDAVMAVFGAPRLHEDDALRAVRAAIELRDSISGLNAELLAERGIRVDFRIGLNSGHVVLGGTDATETLVTGDAVNVAARLEQAAASGQILIGEQTYRLVRGFVDAQPARPLRVKGKARPLRAHIVTGLSDATSIPGKSTGAFVGRERELARLRGIFDESAARRPQLVTLIGPPGIGKSRLVDEFVASLSARTKVMSGRCPPYGEGITYRPITEIVRSAAGIEDLADRVTARQRIASVLLGMSEADRAAELIAGAIGLSDSAGSREELFWAIRSFVEALGSRRPVVCIIEDVHWAESTLLDLLEHVVTTARDTPLLLLCTARPELADQRPGWSAPASPTAMVLDPLSREETRHLAARVVGRAKLPKPTLELVVDRAEGNPLFAEEVVRMLLEERAASGSGDAGSATAVRIPTSIQSVVAARLDRLPSAERALAERASVAGRHFGRDAVVALTPERDRDTVPALLAALVARELIQPDQQAASDGATFRFSHALIWDAAYEQMSKEERSELHERYAAWVAEIAASRLSDSDEVCGYHYEQAYRFRRELGFNDYHASGLARAAAGRLSDAGARAYVHGDPEAAVKLLSRATALYRPSRERREALTWLALAARAADRFGPAAAAAADLVSEAEAVRDKGALWRGRMLDHSARLWSGTGAEIDLEAAGRDVSQALAVFESLTDDLGMALAFNLEAEIAITLSDFARWLRASERAIPHAGAAGDRALEEKHRGWRVAVALWGPTPVPQVLEIAERELAGIRSRPAIAELLQHRALAYAMAGRAESARADVAEAWRIRAEILGNDRAFVFTAGSVEELLGDRRAADRAYRATANALAVSGETGGRSTIVGFLAVLAFNRGRPDKEVEAFAHECRNLTTRDDVTSQVLWRQALALVAARAGRHQQAEQLIAEAGALIHHSDDLWQKGLCLLDRGRINEMAGNLNAAPVHYEAARELFEAKGDIADAARVRRLLERLKVDRA